jgi:uncharacterized membrane protein
MEQTAMSRALLTPAIRTSRPRRISWKPGRVRPSIESLEARLMLDGAAASSLSPPIVVGRTLSAYFAGSVQNNQETITYTVYNEQANAETGVLLTTTLASGVTLVGASKTPDQNGQNLAWSLGSLDAYGRSSVTITVNLATPTASQLDGGAKALAILDARSISDVAPAATLRSGNIDASLLASTPDANTTDPFIQEQAAKLNYDPQAIFNFLHDDIGYQSYVGSLRGARGTLWSGAGNSVDVASLGVALMRASGVPAQYEQGALPFNLIQPLILSMFPPSYQKAGHVPSGTSTGDPLNDSTLYADSSSHHTWFQFDIGDGKGLRDADPLIAGATVGQSFTTSQQTFAEVPDAQRNKTQITLSAETYTQASALFGFGDGLSTSTVLTHMFNDVDLVGRPITIGNFVATSTAGFVISAQTNTYSPYLVVGDDALAESQLPEAIVGKQFQEVITNFPFGTQLVTGFFLDVTLSGPSSGSQTYSRALVDRIGFAARQGLTPPTGLTFDLSTPPVISPFDLTTLNIQAGLQDPRATVLEEQRAARAIDAVSADPAPTSGSQTQSLMAATRAALARFAVTSEQETANLAKAFSVAAYFSSPHILALSTRVTSVGVGAQSTASFEFDLIRDSILAIAAPGQNTQAELGFAAARGLFDSLLEAYSLPAPPGGQNHSAVLLIQQAMAQGIAVATISSSNLSLLGSFNLPAEATARITAAVEAGRTVIVPVQALTVEGEARTAWLEFDPTSGETVAVGQDGHHQGITDYTFVYVAIYAGGTNVIKYYLLNPFNSTPTGAVKAFAQGFVVSLIGAYFLGPILGFLLGIGLTQLEAIAKIDPPLSPLIVDMNVPFPDGPGATSSTDSDAQAGRPAGPVAGSAQSPSVAINGQIAASWSSQSSTSFQLTSLNAAGATVRNAQGNVIGTGTASLASSSLVSAAVSGSANFGVNGRGRLSFHGTAGATAGASGEWDEFAASATGSFSILLTAGSLFLNGQPLPAGTYTITTSSATLIGSGATSSPNFAGSVAITATNATVDVGPGTGGATVGGQAVDLTNGVTLSGYTGTINVVANNGDADAITLNGAAANVLTVSASPTIPSTDQNTPITIQANVQTSLAGAYTITANAPNGWKVAVDGAGKVTVTPAPGVQGGAFPIQIIARSKSNPELVTQTIVNVTITPTQPGITFRVDPDPLFTVPYNGAQLPTAYQAVIHNTGPAADAFNLTFSNLPAGFTMLSSATSLTIPAGASGFVGLYLQPIAGQPLPAPGTLLSFTVTAKSATDATISQSETESFTVPEIHGVALVANPGVVSTTPGAAGAATITISAVGNVAETVSLTASTTAGLSLSGLAPVTLQPGQSTTVAVTLTPNASTPLNSTLLASITATFGSTGATLSQLLQLPVRVVVPGADAISAASIAARQLSDPALADRFDDLATALTNLVQNATDPVSKSQALANLDSLISQLTNDPFLSGFAAGLTTARSGVSAATTAASVQAAVTTLGQALDALAAVITDVAQHGFTVGLTIDRGVILPGAPTRFDVTLKNNGTATTTYDLSVVGLPPGVTASFNRSTVTLHAGESINGGGSNPITLSLSETGDTLFSASFTIVAVAEGASEITSGVPGKLTLRDTFLQVAAVTTNPPFIAAGGQIQVSAKVQSIVNAPQSIQASYVVKDLAGNTVFSSPLAPLSLDIFSPLPTVDVGTFDTTGLADGAYTLFVSLFDAQGQPIGGASGRGTLIVGLPVTTTVATTPTVVPVGDQTVTTTVHVHDTTVFPAPLTILGAVATGDDELSTVLYNNNLAYVVGLNGVSIVDVGDSANPTLLGTFAQDVIVQGGYNIAKVVGNDLIVATTVTLNASGFNFIVYDLTDPLHPQLVSNTPINYRFLGDMFILGDVALVTVAGITFFPGNITSRFGNVVALNISDLAHPTVAGALFAPSDPEINHPVSGALIVDNQIAYATSSTVTGGDTQNGVGRLRILNISDPSHPTLAGNLDIPGTVEITNIARRGNRVLVAGTSGGLMNPFPSLDKLTFTGNLTLTVLDITDPANPTIIGSTLVTEAKYPTNGLPGRRDLVDLGNGLFGLSAMAINDVPELLLINADDPNNIIVAAFNTPTFTNGLTVSGHTLYVGTTTGLSIYDIGQLVSSSVIVSVQVPKDSATLNLVANSFDKPPTQIIDGADFDTYVWKRSLAFGNADASFSWQTKLNNLTPGENRGVTLGASVDFVEQSTSGSLALPSTSVSARQILSISPQSQTVQPLGSVSYTVTLSNPTDAPITYHLSPQDAAFAFQYKYPFSGITVPAQGTVSVPLTITPFSTTGLGDYSFSVTADDFAGTHSAVTATTTVAGPPVVQPDAASHGVVVRLTPDEAVGGGSGSVRYVVRLFNTGSEDDSYSLRADGLPSTVSYSFNAFGIDVPPGASNFRDVVLTITTFGADPGRYPFTVSATSQNKSSITGSTSGSLVIVANGVNVVLDPTETNPGGTFKLTVTNTGTVADTFDLSLGGPGALATALGTTEVALAPGASQVVTITTKAIDFAIQGPLNLVAVATSRGNPAVQDGDSAAITISPTNGMTAQLDAAVKNLATPGATTFRLFVDNTGNAEDAYTATIVGTTGPVTAFLMGLDGNPTLTIPVFRLPGLARGAFLIPASIATKGQGTITIQVRSLNHPELVSTQTATISADATVVAATSTALVIAPSPATVGQAVTFTATVSPSSGSGAPTGIVVFTIDGTAQPPVALQVTNGISRATFSTSALSVGSHVIVAFYGGDSQFAPSTSVSTVEVVVAAASDGPRVTKLQRFGYHWMPTTIVLTFDQSLDAAQAQNVSNYIIIGPSGRRIAVASATYDAATQTVTLATHRRLNIHWKYRLIVNGASPTGLAGSQGLLLDGDGNGQPGGNYRTIIDKSKLVIGHKTPSPAHAKKAAAKSHKATPVAHAHPVVNRHAAPKTSLATHHKLR